MIVAPCIRFRDKKTIIHKVRAEPCADPFTPLRKQYYNRRLIDRNTYEEGYLDEHDNFYTKTWAKKEAVWCGQTPSGHGELQPEELWPNI